MKSNDYVELSMSIYDGSDPLKHCPFCGNESYRVVIELNDEKYIRNCTQCFKKSYKYSWLSSQELRNRKIESVLDDDIKCH